MRRARLDSAAFEHLIGLAEGRFAADEIAQIRGERSRLLARLAVQGRLAAGDGVGAHEVARSIPAGGDRTLWAVAHLPPRAVKAIRAVNQLRHR